MKKKSFKRTRNLIKRIFNVRAWSDWDRMKNFTDYLVKGFKRIFIPNSTEKVESFDAVKTKMNLSDEDLLIRQKSLLRLSIMMVVVSTLIMMYSLYHLFLLNIAAFLLSFVVSMLALMLAFRYHYWHYLIKERKLNCSLNEWYRQGLLGEKP
ncbi:type IVB secretion system protein IcmV [Legionella yabuuchiae]|uniref:type IVB secretion system protein IcmV n=1 Tax=Legionella yabuuchiae TaxID=376727 RepID=UPI0010557B2E|nr:type IVB secretion system protein IcmV [Legionella yabuuchiae]